MGRCLNYLYELNLQCPFFYQAFGTWLKRFMVPCPIKMLTGFDCPGCGFQRSLFALAQGKFEASFLLYPATIPLLLLGIIALMKEKLLFDSKDTIIKLMILITGSIILISYGWKLWLY